MFQSELDTFYQTFLRAVARGRNKPVEEIEPLARGGSTAAPTPTRAASSTTWAASTAPCTSCANGWEKPEKASNRW